MSFKNDFWGGLGKSDKFVYAVAIVVGVPFGIYFGRGKINFLVYKFLLELSEKICIDSI